MRNKNKRLPDDQARNDGQTRPENQKNDRMSDFASYGQASFFETAEEKLNSAVSSDSLPQLASELRAELSDLYLAFQRFVPEESRDACHELDMYAAHIDRTYFRLLRTVNNMNATANLRDPRSYRMEPWNIVDVVGIICDKSAEVAGYKNVDLRFMHHMDRHVILFDRSAIETALYQLLSNALRFTPSGGEIRVALHDAGDKLYLEVSDTGRGMSDQEREAVFQRCISWDQEQNSLSPAKLSLGLPLCHAAARNHGGTLMALSRRGIGSTFMLSIPNRAPTYMQTARQRETMDFDDNGFDPVLLALADAAPVEAFSVRNRY